MLGLLVSGVLFGLVAGTMVDSGKAADVVGLVVIFLPLVLWRRPDLCPVVLLGSAVLIEQIGVTVLPSGANDPGVGSVVLTPSIPITQSIPLYQGIGSIHLEGADLLLLLVFGIYLAKRDELGERWPLRGHVAAAMLALIAMVVVGIFIGQSHHGQLRTSLMEARPYVYLASAYYLTTRMITTPSAVRRMLWTLVAGAIFKAVQGIYVYIQVHNWHPRPEAVLGHEEAYTFSLYLILVAAMWLFNARFGRLRTVATRALPLVILADLANNRRAAWLLLGAGIVTLCVIAYRQLPERRRAISRTAVVVLALSAVYIPAYWHKDGTLAEPARAVRSMISPDPRDNASDLYREQEDANLKYNIRQGGLIGKGFGVPIDYALTIVNISKLDPLIKFVPHNGVLYVLMRMGLLGGVAMWTLIGTAIIAGCRLARSKNRELAVVGALVACAMVAYPLEGATDQGFFFYRIAFITGALLGLAEASRRLARTGRWATAGLAAERPRPRPPARTGPSIPV